MKNANYEIVSESENLIMFKTNCSCMDPDHIITVCVDKCTEDDPFPIVSILFTTHRKFEQYSLRWYQKIWGRIKDCWKILKTGDLEIEGEFMFRNQSQLTDFMQALTEANQQLTKKDK